MEKTIYSHKSEELLQILKLKYPDIYNQIDMEWRIEATNKVLSSYNKKY